MSCQAKSGPGKKWTPWSTFDRKKWTGGGPLFSAKSGPALPKVDLVHFVKKSGPGPVLAGEKSGPGPVSPSKSKQVHFWQGKKVDPVQFHSQNLSRSIFGRGKKWTRSSFAVKIQAGPFLAGVDPVQFSCQNPGRSIFGRGKKWTRSSFLPKFRQVHFWQGKKVDPVQFPRQVHFWQGKKVDPVQFPRQVHFWQGKKVDPVQFRCRNPGRSSGPGFED